MKPKILSILTLGLITASTALAHNGVQNATVMARMNGMSAIADNMKTLGSMAKGATDFDANIATNAATAIAEHAAKTPDLFQAQENDPKSEAKPAIWQDFDDFTEKALDLQTVALLVSNSISTKDDIGPALSELGAACKACHGTYRE